MFRLSIALLFIVPFLFSEGSQTFATEADFPIENSQTDLNLATDSKIVFSESMLTPSLSISSVEPTSGTFSEIKRKKNPLMAAVLSSLLPGLGHYYLGEFETGSELLGGAVLGGVSVFATRNDPHLVVTSILTLQAISSYGVYGAYRDAKLYNGNASPLMPKENFKNLSAAPFQWSVIKKPEVWGGLLGALTAGTAVAYFAYAQIPHAQIKTAYVQPLNAFPVAIGEESFFRGFLQTCLIEKIAPWQAITLSSLAFGAAHIPNALVFHSAKERRSYYTFSLPFITTLGGYMGWMTYKNRSLKESVALHAWYDFTLMCLGAFSTQAAIGGPTHLFHAFDF